MAVRILSASKLRENIASVIDGLGESHEPVYITQHSEPKAVLIDYEQYNALEELVEQAEDILEIKKIKKLPRQPLSFASYWTKRERKGV